MAKSQNWPPVAQSTLMVWCIAARDPNDMGPKAAVSIFMEVSRKVHMLAGNVAARSAVPAKLGTVLRIECLHLLPHAMQQPGMLLLWWMHWRVGNHQCLPLTESDGNQKPCTCSSGQPNML